MCEICAFACKRKYELHSHMLSKHSGADKQLANLKCRYCTYTTCYRQALQNHENCKHTKLKEFRCALCPYSCFSNISLFLHKRKAHGYVPGDKVWLENYTAKEKEKNSVEFIMDFYQTSSSTGEQQPASKGPPQSHKEHPDRPHSADPGTDKGNSQLDPVDLPNVVSQEVVSEDASGNAPPADDPEEFCTLVLTTFSASSLQPEDGNCARKTPSSPTFSRDGSKLSEPKADLSTSLAQDDGTARADPECGQLDLNNSREAGTNTTEAETDAGAASSSSAENNQPLENEMRREALKKHEKEQAENMVLEGRVQMLVVQNQECSHEARSEGALNDHCRALCHTRTKEYQCQACGALFKQQRGLDTHQAKKCSQIRRATRTVSFHKRICADSNDRECHHKKADREDNAARKSLHVKGVKASAHPKENMEEQTSAKVSGKGQKLSCPNCAFKCNQIRALQSHAKRGCLRLGELRCSLCSFGAKSKMSLKHHVLHVHHKKSCGEAKQKRLRCQHCAFTCKQKQCMSLHLGVKHKGARPHRCRYCPFSTTRRYRLQQHESLHTGLGRHGCSVCDKTFGTVTKLRQHKARIHDKQPTHFCSVCDFSGYTLDDVRRHSVRCHSGELKHPCSRCKGRFSSELALRYHCKRVHRLPAAPTTHHESQHPQEKSTSSQESLMTKESVVVHQKCPLAHRCQLCPFATKTRKLLAQHILSEHEEGPSEEKPLKCSTCEFECRHQLVLEQHLRSHGGKRLYKCTDCDYSTRNKQKITWHIRIHTGEKPYGCDLCSYTCTDPSRLKV